MNGREDWTEEQNRELESLRAELRELKEKYETQMRKISASYERGNRLADQLSSLRAAVDMPELYIDDDWRILGYSIHFPGISRKIIDCKNRSAHLSEFLREGDFAKIENYLERVNALKELPYEDGEPWTLVYSGPGKSEQIGRDWIPNGCSRPENWQLIERDGKMRLCHASHMLDDDDCYLMTAGEFGDAHTDLKVVYRIKTATEAHDIKDLSLVISGGSGHEAILPDSLGYTACTANDNALARIQRETASTATITEHLDTERQYEITVERTGGRISREIRDIDNDRQLETLVFIDSRAIYDRQNHVGVHTFSGEAEYFDIQIYTRPSRFNIEQFKIPFDVEVGIEDANIAGRVYKLRLGMYSVRGNALNSIMFDDITQSKLDHWALEKSRQQLRRLSRYLQSVREKERTRIAREIHDELGQILTALKLDLSWVGAQVVSRAGDCKRKKQT